MAGFEYLRRAALVAGALALVAPGAHAQAIFSGSSIAGCGGDAFTSCAIWQAALSNSNKTLTLTVTNMTGTKTGNTASVFTQVILGNLNSYTLSNHGFAVSGAGTWSGGGGGFQQCTPANKCGFSGFGFQSNGFGANAHGNQGIGAGQTAIFQFTFTTALLPADFSDVQLAFHDQGTPRGCSSNKVVFNGNSGAPTTETAAPICGPGIATVPEPASLALLGTGLLGLAPIARRRLRK